MDKTYVIYWKSKVNGRTGTGTTFFDRDEAERLAAELNRDYPEIDHQPRNTTEINGHTHPQDNGEPERERENERAAEPVAVAEDDSHSF